MDLDVGDDRVDCIGLSMELSRGVSGSGSLSRRACTLRKRNGNNNYSLATRLQFGVRAPACLVFYADKWPDMHTMCSTPRTTAR